MKPMNGFGGNCLAAAIAINRVEFNNEGKIVAAVNRAMWNDRNRFLGHVAVEHEGKYYDWDFEPKDWEEIESWGMLDEEEYADELTREECYDVEKLYLDDDLWDFIDIFYGVKTGKKLIEKFVSKI